MYHPSSLHQTGELAVGSWQLGLFPPSPTSHLPSPRRRPVFVSVALILLAVVAATGADDSPATRPLRDLNKTYFPFTPVKDAAAWKTRREEIKQRIQVAAGLWPMPEKTPLHPVIHGRIEKDDYTVEKVFFESLPGHFVTGNLYLPKVIKGKIPAVICPHGHWPNGRFMNESDAGVKNQLAIGAETMRNAAHSPLQARCVQLARMGCAVFFYDMLGYADSVQFPAHRHGPAARGLVSAEAELNLVSHFGLQTWNSIRAMDFIASLPFVDSRRIGCTGASGGGTQTMMVSALDDRVTAAFPCVMVSTAMQGGCTCENANYLRINQGNIDIAAATAPRPLGMTTADDWTKELDTKGFPDLKNLYTLLGVPERVEAHFNIKFPHNYNAVSRAQMYQFFNRHLKLGLAGTSERDFQLLSTQELSVWNDAHPKPAENQVGEPHEVAVVNWFKQEAARKIQPLLHPASKSELRQARAVLGGALQVMVGRKLPMKGEATLATRQEKVRSGYSLVRGTATCGNDKVEASFLYPKKWNRDVVLWLSLKGGESLLQPDGEPGAAAQAMLNRGFAIACPTLYLSDATRNPVAADGKRKAADSYEGFAGFHYGYNPTLFAERVRDALTMIAVIRDDDRHRARHISIAGVEGAGVIAAAATALAGNTIHQLACDTEGFRFAKLTDVWDANFMPGAAKYGDVPAILSLCAPTMTTVAGETAASAPGVAASFAVAKARLAFIAPRETTSVDSIVNALAGGK